MGKGLGYSSEEDSMIASAGLRAGQDAIVRTDQKKEAYMEKMFHIYKRIALPKLGEEIVNQRTAQGIRQRFQKIKEQCKLFHSKVRQVKIVEVSGFDFRIMSDADILKIATFLFNLPGGIVMEAARKVASGEDPSPRFPFINCYKELRDSPGFVATDSDTGTKVLEVFEKSERQYVVDLCNDPSPSQVLHTTARMDNRPIGRKRAKQERENELKTEDDRSQAAAESVFFRIATLFEERKARDRSEIENISIKRMKLHLDIANAPEQDPRVRKEILKLLGNQSLVELRESDKHFSKEKSVHVRTPDAEPEIMESSAGVNEASAEDPFDE